MTRILRIGLAAALLTAAGVVVYGATPLKLPYGPEGKGRFGAYYTTLKYSPEWDAQWRVGSKADVVVRFDQYDYRLVFWRGTNYVPLWVNERRVWITHGCVERPNASPKWDKLCKYSFASVIESNDARVVVRWRYALVNKDGKLVNTDPMTNWNDWVDEYYTIYPDAVCVRRMTLHSSNLKEPVSCQQSAFIGAPSDSDGGAVLVGQLGSVTSQGNDFASAEPAGWPVLDAGVTSATRNGRPALGASTWKPYTEDKTSKSWMVMVHLTETPVAPSGSGVAWPDAPKLTVLKGNCKSAGYDPSEGAYQLSSAAPDPVKLTLKASMDSPTVNPAFVIKGWGRSDISLSIDGKPIPRGPDFRYGFRKTDTVSDLIIWVKKQSTKPVTFEIKPVEGGK